MVNVPFCPVSGLSATTHDFIWGEYKVDITMIHQRNKKTASEHFNKLQLTQLYMVSTFLSLVLYLLLSRPVFHYVTVQEMENKLVFQSNSGANRLLLKLFLSSFLLRL